MALGKFDDFVAYLIRKADATLAKVTDDSVVAHILAIDGDVSDYNDNLHSLEALYNYMVNNLTDVGGLVFKGAVTTYTDTIHFKVSQLSGYGAGAFIPTAGAPYEIYVFQADAAAPEGEQTPVVAYTTGDGTFQHAAFTAPLAVGDVVYIIHPLIASLGTKATAAAAGPVTTADYLMAYIKQLVNISQLADTGLTSILTDSVLSHIFSPDGTPTTFDDQTDSLEALSSRVGGVRIGKVTTATSTKVFASTDLIGGDDDAYYGWWVYVIQADDAAPEGEYRQMSDYSSSTGTVTHPAFTAQLAVGDWVMLIPPHDYEPIAMRGGAQTIQDVVDNQQAMLDYAKNIDTSTLTGAGTEDSIYDKTSTTPFHVVGIWLGLHNMVAGDVIRFRGYMDFDDASIADKFTDDEVWTFGGAQAKKWVYVRLDVLVTYELKFTAEQLDGTAREIYTIVDDGARGS